MLSADLRVREALLLELAPGTCFSLPSKYCFLICVELARRPRLSVTVMPSFVASARELGLLDEESRRCALSASYSVVPAFGNACPCALQARLRLGEQRRRSSACVMCCAADDGDVVRTSSFAAAAAAAAGDAASTARRAERSRREESDDVIAGVCAR